MDIIVESNDVEKIIVLNNDNSPSIIMKSMIPWKTNDQFPQPTEADLNCTSVDPIRWDDVMVHSKKHNYYGTLRFEEFYDEPDNDNNQTISFTRSPYCANMNREFMFPWSDVDCWISVRELYKFMKADVCELQCRSGFKY